MITAFKISPDIAKELDCKLVHKAEEIDKRTKILIVGINSTIDKTMLEKLPELTTIITASTGTDHIDKETCEKRGIKVLNCPSYSTNAVAELAIALLFVGLRRLDKEIEKAKELDYVHRTPVGEEVKDKEITVFGTGKIGCSIVKKLLCLDAKVYAYSRSKKEELIQKGVEYLSFEKALKKEILILSLPLNKHTYHLIDEKAFSTIEDNSAIINVGRGELIDSSAALKHIDRLKFIASDVLEGEAAIWQGRQLNKISHTLLKHPKFIATPHIGANTLDAKKNIIQELKNALKQCSNIF